MRQAFANVLCVAVATIPAFGQSLVPFRKVVLTGDSAPGTNGSVFVGGGNVCPIDQRGRVSFVTGYHGTGDIGVGIWSENSGGMRVVARIGDLAPGAGGRRYEDFDLEFAQSRLFRNRSGDTLFFGHLSDSMVDYDAGWWIDRDGATQPMLIAGDLAQGTAQQRFFEIDHYPAVFNARGQMTVFTHAETPDHSQSSTGIWSGTERNLQLLARVGDPVPGVSGATFDTLTTRPVLNNAGNTAAFGIIEGAGISAENDRGFWFGQAGSLNPAVRTGDPAQIANYRFRTLSGPALNNHGELAFFADASRPPPFSQTISGLWAGRPDALQLVTRFGVSAPGAPGTIFSGLSFSPLLGNGGAVVFQATLGGAPTNSDTGIWVHNEGSLSMVIREGDAAPGAPGATMNFRDGTSDILINGRGQVAFLGLLRGDEVTPANAVGIWATDPMGELMLVARQGDPFEVAPGDIRIIETLFFRGGSGGGDGRATSFNDSGQLAVAMRFVGGTAGVFVAQIPAPPMVSVCALGVCMTMRRRRECLGSGV